MPTNFGKPTKYPNFALFCFIECLSIIFKLQQVKFLQIEGWFVRTPHKQLKWKSRIFSFWRTKCFKLQSCDLICFSGSWLELTFQSDITHRCLIGSVLQMIKFMFVDLLSKSEFCWCEMCCFSKFQKFLDFKLLIQMALYQRENVQFWWLTRRWKAQILNFLTHCSTLSQLCFPLLSVEKSLKTVY